MAEWRWGQVAAAACLSGDVIPAGTLAECRAFDGKERCCAASKDDEIGAAIRGYTTPSPLGPRAGCFLALGSGLGLVGTASARQ